MKINLDAIGITSMGCHSCATLKQSIEEHFNHHGIAITFNDVVYEFDPDHATEICEEYGLDDLPSYFINGVVFKVGFTKEDVEKALRSN